MTVRTKEEPGLFADPKAKAAPAPKPTKTKERRAQGGYVPQPGPKPKVPATGSGVKPAPAKKQEVVVHQPQATLPEPRSVLELCMMAAKDPSIPTDRLRAFLDMADQQERKEAEILFDHAMLAAQSEMPAIPRESYNKHTKSWWARIEAVSAKIDPVIRKNGFTLKFGIGEQRIPDHYHLFVDVTWNGVLSSGKKASYTKRYDADIGRDDKGPKGEGTKTLAQGAGSSITYGRRYLKCMVFDVLVLGLDKDGNPASADDANPNLITEEQEAEILRLCAEKNIGKEMFGRAYRVGEVSELPARRYEEVVARLKMAPKQPTQRTAEEQASDE